MTVNPNRPPTSNEILSFYLCGSVGIYAVVRNAFRIHRYLKAFKAMMGSLEKYRHNLDEIQNIKNNATKDMAFLQTVFPNFATHYFRNTQNPARYKTREGRFYEELECDSGFEALLRYKGKEYSIYCQMDRPSVGFQIAKNCLKFDEQGIKFHRNQMISVYGQLTYEKNKKKYIMKTKMLGLDSIELVKFWQAKLIATVISTFYFSILLGVSLSLWFNLSIPLPHQLYHL